MKVKNFKEKFSKSTMQDLRAQLAIGKQELLKARLDQAAGKLKDCSRYKKLRRMVARIKTYMSQKMTEM
jgi:ribosomal protein L29